MLLAESLGLPDDVTAIPIVEPEVRHAIGLIVPYREPATPFVSALVAQARRLAQELAESESSARF